VAAGSTPKRLRAVVVAAVTCGLLAAAAAFPVVALAGSLAKTATDSFDDLPAELRIPPSAQASYLYAADGTTLITSFYDEDRTDVPLSEVATVLQQAVVAAEDERFFEHGAVDLRSVVRALVSNRRGGGVQQGASTLTMQYVRNVLKSDPNLTETQREAATADTAERKLQEIRYATALEKKLSKQEILDRYLNIAYFGDGAYGIAAASRIYFTKPAADLTLPEAALLAGLLQSPDVDNPVAGDRTAALRRRAYVLDSMVRMGVISPEQATSANSEPLRLRPSQDRNGCTAVPAGHDDWGLFCDYVRQWWDAQPALGATAQEREYALRRGGYRIVTSLDPGVQAAALRQSLHVYGYDSARALPMAVVQPGTGRVLAMAVNRHYSLAPNPSLRHTYPNTVNQLVAGGGGVDGYQAGSTFKLFTMLAALEAGLPLNTGFDAPATLETRWPASGPGSCHGHYCPANANPQWMDGRRTMWTAFGRSVNTYWVWLEQQVGPQNAVAMAKRLGITFRAPGDARLAAESAAGWGSFTLGVADTTPLDLAEAYATVAAGGVYCQPLPVLSIADPTGKRLPAADPACRRAVGADVAAAAVDAARCPVGQQSYHDRCDGGTAPDVSAILGDRPVAGKTGSSERNATETFVGVTPQIAAAAIAADPDDPHDYVGAGVSGEVDAAVARTMAVALGGQPYRDFPIPSPQIAFGR
jgi:membrane peptidoglycan carboxypeptidase